MFYCRCTLLSRYEITGFPTLKLFPAGGGEPIAYNNARELPNLVDFINENAGTARLPNGELSPLAGSVEVLDELIAEASAFDEAFVTKMEALVKELDQPTAEIYLSFAKKIAAKGTSYIETELTRLRGMTSSKSVSPEKKKGFFLKANVLKKFVKA